MLIVIKELFPNFYYEKITHSTHHTKNATDIHQPVPSSRWFVLRRVRAHQYTVMDRDVQSRRFFQWYKLMCYAIFHEIWKKILRLLSLKKLLKRSSIPVSEYINSLTFQSNRLDFRASRLESQYCNKHYFWYLPIPIRNDFSRFLQSDIPTLTATSFLKVISDIIL